MEMCEAAVKERLDKVAEERKKSQEQYSNTEEEVVVTKKAAKRKIEDSGRWKNLGPSLTKISKINPEKDKSNEVANNNIKSKTAPPPGYKEEDEHLEEDSHNLHEFDHKISIFVSNLDYTATEEEIREALKSVFPITLFRIIKDYKGRSKGYCYVQLSSPVWFLLHFIIIYIYIIKYIFNQICFFLLGSSRRSA